MVVVANANEESGSLTSTQCPDIIVCGTGDTSKETYATYLYDQKAYQCYYKLGDVEMAKIASSAATRCLTMYGSINPIIRH